MEKYIESFKTKTKEFLHNIEEEGVQTKEAFQLLAHSVSTGTELSDEDKHKIGEQLKDVLKTIGVIGIAMLPGGSVFFVVSSYFKLNKYLLPTAFLEKNVS